MKKMLLAFSLLIGVALGVVITVYVLALASIGTQKAANSISLGGLMISFLAAVATVSAVIIAFRAILDNRKQAREDWQHTQQLAREERQHQGRPVLVPKSDISNFAALPNKVETTQEITIQNMGNGPAFNVHCALYFPLGNWYSSWNNGPVSANSPCTITFERGSDNIGLGIKDSVDGKYHLYNDEDTNYRAGRLTMTYRDLFDILHVSIFDYIVPASGQHRWVQLAIKSGIEKDLEDLDNERVQNWRRIKPDH